MVFTGTYEHSIDAKNRLAIPADIRNQIQDEAGRESGSSVFLFVTLGEDEALNLYTEARFDQRAGELDRSELDAEQLLKYERVTFSLARRVEIDPQGRVRLPDNLLQMTGLGSDVVLLGVKDHLEIRDRTKWQDYVKQVLMENRSLLVNPRRAMKKAE